MSLDPLKEEWDRCEWRIHYNAELNGLIEGHDIVRFVRAQRKHG
jgi:hypothetical protein